MAHFVRQWLEDKEQGVNECVLYTMDTLPWGGNPSAVVVVVKLNGVVVDTVTTGEPSVDGHVIHLPLIHSLLAGKRYRVSVRWTSGGNTFESFGFINVDQ